MTRKTEVIFLLWLVILHFSITSTATAINAWSKWANLTTLRKFNPTDVILQNCHVAPNINSPDEFEGALSGRVIPTNVSVVFEIDRFFGIKDVEESFAFTGVLVVAWHVPCIAAVANNPDLWPVDYLSEVVVDSSKFWHPTFYHRNAMKVVDIKKELNFHITLQANLGVFTGVYYGLWESYCDLDFAAFPFDIQTCSIKLLPKHPTTKISVVSMTFIRDDKAMPSNSNWQYRSNKTIKSELIEGDLVSVTFDQLIFNVTMERSPDYYFINLMGPLFILEVLLLGSFLIPPNDSNRAAYSCTVLLALFVLQAEILSNMPTTPKPVVISNYVLGTMVYAMFIVLYSGTMCLLIDKYCDKMEREVEPCCSKGAMPLYNAIEIAFGVIFTAVLVVFNVASMTYMYSLSHPF